MHWVRGNTVISRNEEADRQANLVQEGYGADTVQE
jgi:hypothetical protein